MCSCTSNYEISNDDKDQLFNNLTKLNECFNPLEKVVVFNNTQKKWEYYDGSGTFLSDSELNKMIIEKIEQIKTFNILSDFFLNRIEKSLNIKENVNLGVLLTSHEFGDQMIRILPKKINVDNEYCLEYEWLGDEEFLNMNDDEFKLFLITRISQISSKKAVFKIPYAEASVTPCDQHKREKYNYSYYFIKNKDGKWLIDDIKIEKTEN